MMAPAERRCDIFCLRGAGRRAVAVASPPTACPARRSAVRGDILPKAESETDFVGHEATRVVAIPEWMEQDAPGAAEAVRMISLEDLSEPQRQRLARLVGEGTRYAWREPARNARANRKSPTKEELWAAHFELLWEAYRAADFQPVGKREMKHAKEKLLEIETAAEDLAKKFREVGNDGQVRDLWHLYRHKRHDDEVLANLPNCLYMATALDGFADFFRSAASIYKPEGAVPPVGQPKDLESLKTTVIRKIAETCERHFGTKLYGTVATLANASLDRDDLTAASVRSSVR